MRKRTVIGALALLLVSLALLSSKLVFAQNFWAGNNVAVNQSQPIDRTVYAAGRTVDISSEVNGDVFCAGMNITVSATVHGDVICAGQTVNITGTVDGDVRLAGQTVTISGQVNGNATIGAQSFTLSSGAKISGDMTLGGSDANINGTIGRDLTMSGQTAIITGTVGRDVKANTSDIQLTSSASIGGNIDYRSYNDLQNNGAKVAGKVTRSEPVARHKAPVGTLFAFSFIGFLYWMLAMIFAGLLLALILPQTFQDITNQAMPRPWKALLTGVVAAIVVPMGLLVLAVTVIGIPVAILFGLIWMIIGMLSTPAFGYYVGRYVVRKSTHPIVIMLVGLSILTVVYFIPVFGVLAFLASLFIGSGMILMELGKRLPKPKYNLAKVSARK